MTILLEYPTVRPGWQGWAGITVWHGWHWWGWRDWHGMTWTDWAGMASWLARLGWYGCAGLGLQLDIYSKLYISLSLTLDFLKNPSSQGMAILKGSCEFTRYLHFIAKPLKIAKTPLKWPFLRTRFYNKIVGEEQWYLKFFRRMSRYFNGRGVGGG